VRSVRSNLHADRHREFVGRDGARPSRGKQIVRNDHWSFDQELEGVRSLGAVPVDASFVLPQQIYTLRKRLSVPRRSRYHAVMFSRDQLKRAAPLTEEDCVQLGRCRRPHIKLRESGYFGWAMIERMTYSSPSILK
jgi:hypothetical protein